MIEEIIQLENVSKEYVYPNRNERGIGGILKACFSQERFIALDSISLSIKDSECVAFIGKNGAGKSLLFKAISGIVKPSSGIVTVKKRIYPLFEYGTGFTWELSARDNIYLYGSLLGARKNEIKKSFDEIVAFSELEQFLNTKMKRFSLGMAIRLAFSIASMLNPEILILDEVLSNVDQSFIKKVYNKISDLQKQNITILISSHSLDILRMFCKKAFVLDKGKLLYSGDINNAISFYEREIVREKILENTFTH